MQAYVLSGYGGAERAGLRDWPVPTPGPHELLIKVAAAGLNPVDYKTRKGMLKTIYRPALPFVLGNELAGEVVARGARVTRFDIGAQVIARVEKDRMGAFAQMACIGEDVAALAPRRVSLVDAAGLPLAGLTALQALRDELHAGPGKHILITGGAGGVGTFAIQLAKRFGATVTTTASPRGAELVRKLGADHVIDYTTTELASVRERYDDVFDLVGGSTLEQAMALAKPGGMVLSIAGMPEPTTAAKDLQRGRALQALFWLASFRLRRAAARYRVRYRYLFMRASGTDLAELAGMVDAGELKLIIDRRFAFADIGAALAYLESGRAKGKVLVQL